MTVDEARKAVIDVVVHRDRARVLLELPSLMDALIAAVRAEVLADSDHHHGGPNGSSEPSEGREALVEAAAALGGAIEQIRALGSTPSENAKSALERAISVVREGSS